MKKRSLQLEQLYKQYAKSLYYYLVKLGGSTHLAEDLTQETFVRATIHLHTYDGEHARAWLFRVARNVYLDEWRKQKRRQTIPLISILAPKAEMISPYGLPEESMLAREQTEQIVDLLSYLSEQYRSILYLREYEQFSYKEIMDAMLLTENQVKVTLHRARKRLAQLAEKKGWKHDGRME
ncbi:RNA polymerase [Ammoniphilus oxalaticus]|uniref:RNA polymerase n=1 Tax=Ammoniphilus oxalaticus TaxID=66863 RepID=A0A419SNS4_9BACL|nr:sigma-70 family RNA polymerase sigma factor [Ammoniphilus oxalaticus]RKD25879.1 RNA polymerase [Ammoniphilus oxalaticus]